MPRKNKSPTRHAPHASNEGWFWPANEKHAHYFVDGVSLCDELEVDPKAIEGELDPICEETSDDCRACHRALRERKRNAA